MLQLSATGLKPGEASASIEVPVEIVRNMVVHAIIARSTAPNMEAVITAVRLGLIEPPPCHL